MTDEKLYRCFKDGDARAFETLYYRYRARLYGYIVSIVWNRHDSDEVLQEVFAALARSNAKMSRPGSFRSYIFHASRNRAIDVIRRRETAGRVRASLRNMIVVLPAGEGDTRKQEEQQALNRALYNLVPGERETIMLKVYSGFTFREIAELTSTPMGTVTSRYRAALGKLREKVGTYVH